MSKLSSAIPSEQNLAANFANQHESDKEIDSRSFVASAFVAKGFPPLRQAQGRDKQKNRAGLPGSFLYLAMRLHH
jgi:hypothetical protein